MGLLKVLAGHIRARRKLLGLTQEQLAEQAGLSPNYIARLELGNNKPSMSTLISLAEALGVQVSELLLTGSEFPWQDDAQEIARVLVSMDALDREFTLRQLHTIVSYIRSKSEPHLP